MTCNGIDTEQLAAFGKLVVEDPNAAAISARVRTRWQGSYGIRASTEELTFGEERIPRAATLTSDRPRAFGGADRGPAPGELLLAALGSCVAQAFIEGAAMTGIHIDRLEITAEGFLDLRGNAGVQGVRPGMTRILLDVEVDSGADAEVLDGLLGEAVRLSPIADSLAGGVAIGASVRQPRLQPTGRVAGGASAVHRGNRHEESDG